jgi:hypothetical protein
MQLPFCCNAPKILAIGDKPPRFSGAPSSFHAIAGQRQVAQPRASSLIAA